MISKASSEMTEAPSKDDTAKPNFSQPTAFVAIRRFASRSIGNRPRLPALWQNRVSTMPPVPAHPARVSR